MPIAHARRCRLLLLAACLLSPAGTLPAEPGGIAARDALSDRLAGTVNDYLRAHPTTRLGAAVVDLQAGPPVYTIHAEEPLTPASNQKLLTSAFALEVLGEDFRFATKLYAVQGDLLLLGDFDPLLGDPVLAKRTGRSLYDGLDRLARAAAAAQPPDGWGSLRLLQPVASEHARPEDWPRRHHHRWFGAPVSGLNFHNNCYDITFAERNGQVVPVVAPASRSIRVVDRTRPGNKQLWRLTSSEDEAEVVISGTVRTTSRDPISAPMANPPAVLGRVFADRLEQAGVKLHGNLRLQTSPAVPPDGARLLGQLDNPITAVLARANRRSLNLAAESLLLRAGGGNCKQATAEMHRKLLGEFGLDGKALRCRDGSGLSATNRVSAENMLRLLTVATTRPWFENFLASLPRSGQSGTMRRRLKGERTAGRVAAKTGYLHGVVCLSGYVLDAAGKPRFAFSFLLNDVRGVGRAQRLQDRLCATLVEAAGPKDHGTVQTKPH